MKMWAFVSRMGLMTSQSVSEATQASLNSKEVKESLFQNPDKNPHLYDTLRD